jgi:hypothetical protein
MLDGELRVGIFDLPSFPVASFWRTPPSRLACGLVAVGRRAILMVPKGKGPHARHSNRRGVYLEDAADDDAISKHVEIVVIPFTGGTRGRSAFEGEVILLHRGSPYARTDIRPLLIGPFTLTSSGEPSPGSELAPWGRVLSE